MSKKLAAVLAAVAFVGGAAFAFGFTELAEVHPPTGAMVSGSGGGGASGGSGGGGVGGVSGGGGVSGR